MKKQQKILVANRGEIACRIIRAIQECNMIAVAIYSDVDRTALHVLQADEAYLVGGASSTESYLNMQKIIDVAKEAQVEAIHPGYGFLSENAIFAKLVTDHNITFIGPSADVIKKMGDKITAKQIAAKNNVPLIPGTQEAITNINEAKIVASEIGFPVMLKASAGGGGKGMRIVYKEEEFEAQFERARSESLSAFGSDDVFIEKYIESPRHIEIQILGDTHGNIVHLYERDCSIQRRHQKVIEEAPSSFVDQELRQSMTEAALRLAKAVGYVSAGTVEFIVDKNKSFYFLEMNTRLQVEHPVTELITGVDLVIEQLHIAKGKKLSFTQEDIVITGHAIELRVYAEDPFQNFIPDIGTLETYRTPKGHGVRIDDGVIRGTKIPIYYDPMLSKLITYAKNRESAIQKMRRAIKEYKISGVMTTLYFGKFVMENEHFLSGNFSTNFVAQHYNEDTKYTHTEESAKIAAIIGFQHYQSLSQEPQAKDFESNTNSPWFHNRT